MRNCPSFGLVLRRLALPFLLFSAVLFGLLVLSWVLLMPRLTEIEVAGTARDAVHLQAYVLALEENVMGIEEKRSALVTPLRDSLYGILRETKYTRPPFLLLKAQVEQAAAEIVPGRSNVVDLTRIRYRSKDNVIELQGSVQHVGPRSMTVLGQYIDALKKLPLVSDVTLPRFERKNDDNGNIYSPFSFELHVR